MTLELEERQDCVYGPSLSTCSNFLFIIIEFKHLPDLQIDNMMLRISHLLNK